MFPDVNKAQRIAMILRIRDELQSVDYDHEALVLNTFGIGARPDGTWGESPSLVSWLSTGASDEQLLELGSYLKLPNVDQSQWSQKGISEAPLFLFASHLSTERYFVTQIAEELKLFGITLFVAHDSIPMDALWERDIANALTSCHAGVAFAHDGFHNSYYCMQEVGWLIGRDIPIARLIFGEAPKGLLGAKQGKSMTGRDAAHVATEIVDWSFGHAELLAPLADSLTRALLASPSYNRTDRIWYQLKRMPSLTAAQIARVLEAAEMNDQVYDTGVSGYGGPPYRTVITNWVTQRDPQGLYVERIANLCAAPAGEKVTFGA